MIQIENGLKDITPERHFNNRYCYYDLRYFEIFLNDILDIDNIIYTTEKLSKKRYNFLN